jgi:uracil-DNA glycosylase
MSEIKLESSWKKHLESEFSKPYMTHLKQFLLEEKKQGKIIYPKGDQIFAAFNTTPLSKVKVVILGQDPYHGPGQAHGLSFSVPDGVAFPPSLRNIFKELHDDLQVPIPKSGCLVPWAEQGVLLLNSVLTVEQGKAGSHQKKGWEQFTDAAIQVVNEQREHVVFILWGAYAQKKAAFVDHKKHLVLESVHPSPLSSHRGFFGSKPFSKTNQFLKKHDLKPINWDLTSAR